MSLRRFGTVFAGDFSFHLRRPLFWIWAGILLLTAWGLSGGNVRIASGDTAVGGTKAWLTSEFSLAHQLSLLVLTFYSFFVAVAAGMAVIRDRELRVGELLHPTPLRPGEYVWAKFAALGTLFLLVLAIHLGLSAFFFHLVPSDPAKEIHGPFLAASYLRPALVFGLPLIFLLAGTSFWLGTRTSRPVLVFVFPLAFLLLCSSFLWNWSPGWLPSWINRLLMLADPPGFRWLNETWLKVDRGVDFYNRQPIRYDFPFLASRVVFFGLGLLAVARTGRAFGRELRGSGAARSWLGRRARRRRTLPRSVEQRLSTSFAGNPLAPLGMRTRPPGRLAALLTVARFEIRELRSSPGMYLFGPLILIQVLGSAFLAVGPFSSPLLVTPGLLAAGSMGQLAMLLCLLLLFYTVESVRREQGTGLASIYYATPVPTSAILFGKALANGFVAGFILLIALLGGWAALAVQGRVAFHLRPFLVVWGLVLVPTLIFWNALVLAAQAVFRNRFTTYAVCLALLLFTGYQLVRGNLDWVGNWPVWGALRWSDMGVFELDREALILNRILVLSAALFFGGLALRLFPRREADATRALLRLRPRALLRSARALLPLALLPLAAGITLGLQVRSGFQGSVAKRAEKDWRKNLATWKDAPLPAVEHAELDLDLEPDSRHFRMQGSYRLVNRKKKDLLRFPLTPGRHFADSRWTLDGEEVRPEDRSGLLIFQPPQPLPPGGTLQLGFSYEGVFPGGITKNGGGAAEFILPSGVVLTSFGPSFVPVIGYLEGVGVDKDNRFETRDYPDDFYQGVTPPAFGQGAPFTVRMKISAPRAFTLNGVGVELSDEVAGGRRTVVWESDHPVNFFNVVAGRWAVRKGEGTAIYFTPRHPYNIEEMGRMLDAARKWYSAWFQEYPWEVLKVSQFPNLASYAQGFATNISFSEGIGFLTKSDPRSRWASLVIAHESAHQWWGNLLVPGKGPGGNILSEGMAHFSSILLFDQVYGLHDRIELCKRIEEDYEKNRSADSERPLYKIDGSRGGDQAVTYDKGGWVFWMLLNRMGRERALQGLRAFLQEWGPSEDHPVLQDFVRVMGRFAGEEEAYEDFVEQWFAQVVLPEFRLEEVRREEAGEIWKVTGSLKNLGTGHGTVEVAASRGERFLEDGALNPDFEEVRKSVEFRAGEAVPVALECSFEPERVVVDPDALQLQTRRARAVHRF
ncbi:MAG: ABC transporter permease/M1 family aminopeptidase [Planctomycetota bacterium]